MGVNVYQAPFKDTRVELPLWAFFALPAPVLKAWALALAVNQTGQAITKEWLEAHGYPKTLYDVLYKRRTPIIAKDPQGTDTGWRYVNDYQPFTWDEDAGQFVIDENELRKIAIANRKRRPKPVLER